MEIRQIKYFRAVAELKSFTRASIHCRLTQPAMSRQIKALEEELGVALLVRDGRGAHLTPAGSEFYRQIIHLDDVISDAVKATKAYGNGKSVVSLGAPPSLGPSFLATVAEELTQKYNGLDIRLVEGYSYQLADWLLSGRLDMALLYGGHEALQAEHIASVKEDLFLVCPNDELGVGQDTPFSDLVNLTIISPDLPSTTRAEMERLATLAGVELSFKMQIDSVPAIKSMVSQGLGYAVLPFAAIEHEVRNGDLGYRPIVQPTPNLSLQFVQNIRSGQDRIIYGASETILKCIVNKVGSNDWRGTSVAVHRKSRKQPD